MNFSSLIEIDLMINSHVESVGKYVMMNRVKTYFDGYLQFVIWCHTILIPPPFNKHTHCASFKTIEIEHPSNIALSSATSQIKTYQLNHPNKDFVSIFVGFSSWDSLMRHMKTVHKKEK